MGKTYIFGHKNPDTDSITSSLVMANFEKAQGRDAKACRLGKVNKETEYVPVEYPSTTEIMADLHELEMEITKGLAELEEML